MTEETNKENQQEDDEEMVDIEVWEFTLDGEEIDELIDKLKELKETKKPVSFDVDEDNELLINYEEGEE